MFRIYSLLIAFNLFSYSISAQPPGKPKLLIIGLDGIRPDALKVANTPNLDLLMNNGLHSYDALTRYPTKTVPGFASMMCGVWYEKHGVSSNSLSGTSRLNRYPYFLRYAEQYDSTLVTAICTNSGLYGLQQHVTNEIDTAIYATKDHVRKLMGEHYLTNHDPDIFFQYFGGADYFGHNSTFSPLDTAYTKHIELLDSYVGDILSAVMSRTNYAAEDWIVLVSTDHGGIGNKHGGDSFEERNIFFIVSGKNIPTSEIKRDSFELMIDTALAFNGNDNYVSIPVSATLPLDQNADFTIECRVKAGSSSALSYILSNQNSASDTCRGFSIVLNPLGFNQWVVNMADGTQNKVAFGKQINDNKYHHLTVSVKQGDYMKLYQDGIYLDKIVISQLQDITSPFPIHLGQDGPATCANFFDGNLSEVRLWKCALPDSTISQFAHKSINASHPRNMDLIGYWKMNENSGSIASDRSGNGNDGAVMGSTVNWTGSNAVMTTYDYSNTPRIVDVAATALQHFCIPINPSWEMDGRSWVDYGCTYYPCTEVTSQLTQNLSYTSTKLVWNSVGAADHYILRWKELNANNHEYIIINQGTVTEKTLAALSPNTRYEWQIQTLCGPNGFPFAQFSKSDTFTTLGCTAPEPIYTSHVSDTSAQLNWTTVPVSTNYQILGLNLNTLDLYDVSAPANSQSKLMSNLVPGNSYAWKVRSTCMGTMQSDFSEVDYFYTIPSSDINPNPRYPEYEVTIFPNPVNKQAIFEVDDAEEITYIIQIKSLSGVIMTEFTSQKGPRFEFHSAGLPRGIYYVDIIGNKVHRGKIVIY